MKAILIHALMLSGLLVAGGALGTDWRKEGDDAERLQKLVELVPGTAHWMIEMGDRYQNLYWAAKQGKWEFATYQSEEIEKLMQVVMLARPKRAASAQMFLDNGDLAAAEPLVGSLIESGEMPSVLRVRARYAYLRGDADRAVELMETFKSTFADDWTEADAAALERECQRIFVA